MRVMLARVMIMVLRGIHFRRQGALLLGGQFLGQRHQLAGKLLHADPSPTDAMAFERLVDFRETGLFHDVRPRDEKMRSGSDLFALQRVVPEPLLPTLRVNDRDLHREGEAAQTRLQGQRFDEQLAIGGAIGFHE